MEAVYQTATWKTRRRDHVWASILWNKGNAAAGKKSPLLRAGVETRPNFPMLHGYLPPRAPVLESESLVATANRSFSEVRPFDDFLISVPYVDLDSADPSPWRAAAAFNLSSSGRRDVAFFFGGRTSTALGPGRAQTGYYVRWWLMRQWAASPSSFRGLLEVIDSDSVGAVVGDVPSSPRAYEAIRNGAIPVFVADGLWRVGVPFQCLVPWRLMSATISEREFATDAAGALRGVADRTTPHAEHQMRKLIAHFGRDLLWRHPASRVAENLLIEAARWRLRRAGEGAGCCALQDEIVD